MYYSPSTASVTKPEVILGLFGQSFSEALFADPARKTFIKELNDAGYPVTVIFHGIGGSAALKENTPAGYPDRYWWDLDKNKPGPQLETAIRILNESIKKPTIIMWLQGEADSIASGDSVRYYNSTLQIIWKLKQAANPSDPNSISSYMHVIGRRLSNASDLPKIQMIRSAQLNIIDRTSLNFLVDIWDLSLLGENPLYTGNSHMDSIGNTILGWRAAQVILNKIGYGSEPPSSLQTMYNIDGEKVRLIFYVQPKKVGTNFLTNPAQPSHIAVSTGSTTYKTENLRFNWVANNVLEIILPVKASNPITVMYPYGAISQIDRANIIKDQNGTVIQSFSITK